MNLLQELLQLMEAIDTTSINSENVKSMKDHIDACARVLFGTHGGPVKDLKRSKEPIFYGLSHHKSLLMDHNGKPLHLTFDNSTDSGEFEINSLVPLMIERGSAEDEEIRALYRKYEVKSKKKTNYIAHADKIVLREVHVGKDITVNTVKFIKALVSLLEKPQIEDPEKDQEEEDPKADSKASMKDVKVDKKPAAKPADSKAKAKAK